MKRFFFILSLLISVSIGQVWATDFTLSSADSVTKDGITVSFEKGSGSTAPTWYSAGLRFYASNTITISCDNNITGVTFNWEKQGSKAFASVTANPGTYTHPSNAGEGTWTGSAKSITFTLGGSGQLQLNTLSVTAGAASSPSLSVDKTTIDFGTIEKGTNVGNQEVTVTFANLTGSVTYSGLSSPFTASGTVSTTGSKITISANTSTAGDYSQTLTVQSASDSKSAEVTVKMKVEEPFEGKKLTFDFVTHPEGWPTAKAAAAAGDYTYSLNSVDYTFTHSKTGDGIYMTGTSGTSGALLIVSGNTLGFPAISGYKLVKVDGTLNSAGTPSTGSSVSITDGSNIVSGGTAQTWDTKGGVKTYNLSGTAANTRYYLSVASKNLQMMTLVLYYEEAAAPEVATPTISGEENFTTSTTVTLSCTTEGATIYYTTDNSTPTSSSSAYSDPFQLNATATVKAIAIKGETSSSVAEKTFTKIEALTTMDAIFAAATEAGSTARDVYIKFDNWQISGVKNSNAFLTDGTKGAVIYGSNGSGFAVNNVLSGTVACKVQLYKQFAEITSLTSSTTGLTVTSGSALTPVVKTIDELSAVNTGALVKVENLDYDGTNLSDGTNTIVTFTTFYTATLVSGKKYTITGIFQYFDGTKQLLPRSADDIQLITSKELSSISLSGTYPTTFEQGDSFSHTGITVTANYSDATTEDVTSSATFSGYDLSATGEQTVTVSYTENSVTKTTSYTITVNAPATGEWELFDGALSDLVAGDYLIYDDGSLMLAQISSSRFAYEEKQPDANGVISTPSKYAIWTFAKSGDYWTFYNSQAGKYAAGNGTKNQGALNADGTVDASKWSISDEFVITNKGNAAGGVNAVLRHNSTYGFACYAASTGNQPVLYKKSVPSYSIEASLTGCSAVEDNPAKVPQTLTEDVILKFNLTTGYVWPNAISVEVGGVELDADNLDYLWDNAKNPAELTIAKEVVNGNISVTITATEKALSTITIAQAPTKTSYLVGEKFNPAGLQIQLNYTSGDPDVVVYGDETKDNFSFSPDLETALAADNDNVVITYSDKSVSQAITVTAPVAVAKTVVIIAEYDNVFYAMSTGLSNKACPAIEVTKDGENIVVTSDADKTAIQWLMTTTGNDVTFQDAGSKYLKVSSKADLALVDESANWSVTQESGEYLIASIADRAILYQESSNVFKNYATSNITGYARISEIFEVAEGAANIIVNAPVVEAEFTVSPDEDVAFGSVAKDEVVTAKSFDVTLTNIDAATVTLDGAGKDAFSIDQTSLTADGTITVTPVTSTTGSFSATITLHDNASVAADKVINVSMTVTSSQSEEGTWMLVTDVSQLEDGTQVIIASTIGDDGIFTMGTQKSNNRAGVQSAVDSKNLLIPGDETEIFTMTKVSDKVFVIQASNENYLYAASSTGNQLKEKSTIDDNAKWSIAIQNGVTVVLAQGTNTRNLMRFNPNNDSPIFACYASNTTTGRAVELYIPKPDDPEPPTPDYGSYQRSGLTVGYYGTICLPNAGTIANAKLFDLEYYDGASTLYLLEVNGNAMEAGHPYVFLPSATSIEVTYTDNAGASAGSFNGLVGSYTQETITADAGNYILYNNMYYLVNSTAYVGENRAYIHMPDVPDAPTSTPQGDAPRRRVAMNVNGRQVATGISDIETGDQPIKVMIDGNLYIIRAGQMYDMTGSKVK
ncbi:MAG: chitobiase/beta-hexosaminidase C-terminal domain-containing protein [Paludibacteraceae bacterium]|nr:chitobiase/beta-hexosaminidase C-terminal domain-containing protein [Paludibacteraceae bacterium]